MPHPPNIALTPQTDERNFPICREGAPPGQSGHAYPRMLTRPCTAEDREAWRTKNKRMDRTTREEYWEDRPPKVGDPIPVISTLELVDAALAQVVGEPVIVHDAEDEKTVREMLGLAAAEAKPSTFSIPIRGGAAQMPGAESPLERLRRENDELEAEIERRAKLKAAQTGDAPEAKQNKRPGRKPRVSAPEPERVLSLEEMAASVPETVD